MTYNELYVELLLTVTLKISVVLQLDSEILMLASVWVSELLPIEILIFLNEFEY